LQGGTAQGKADPIIPVLLSSFERMLSFQIHALLATSQHPARTLALIKFFMRVIQQCTEDAEKDAYATQAQQLLADMALRIALSAVDADTAAAASEMLSPGSAHLPRHLLETHGRMGTCFCMPRT
jgi:signal transduction histidine kinase